MSQPGTAFNDDDILNLVDNVLDIPDNEVDPVPDDTNDFAEFVGRDGDVDIPDEYRAIKIGNGFDAAAVVDEKNIIEVSHLKDFLTKWCTRTMKGDQNTNLIDQAHLRTYKLPPGPPTEAYFNLIDNIRKKNFTLSMSERQYYTGVPRSGLMLDFDILQPSAKTQLDEEVYQDLVFQLTQTLKKLLNFDLLVTEGGRAGYTFHVFFITRPAVSMKKITVNNEERVVYKDGFHLLIPELWTTKGFKRLLYETLLSDNVVKNVFSDFNLCTPVEKLLDIGSIVNPVLFYGSAKASAPGESPPVSYPLTHAWSVQLRNNGQITMKSVDIASLNKYNLCYELSLTYRMETFNDAPTFCRKIDIEPRDEYLIASRNRAEMFSIPTDVRAQLEREIDSLAMVDPEASWVYTLAKILPIDYATDYEKWFKVVCAIAGVNTRFKPIAEWFSRRAPDHFDIHAFNKKWNDACRPRENKLGLSALVYWARTDAKIAFEGVRNTSFKDTIMEYAYENKGAVEHAIVASILRIVFTDRLVYSANPNGESAWYEFSLPDTEIDGDVWKWRKIKEPTMLNKYINGTMRNEIFKSVLDAIEAQRKRISERMLDAQGAELVTLKAKEKYHKAIESGFRTARTKLNNNTFHVHAIEQARKMFIDPLFHIRLNRDGKIIGVGNGVLELGKQPRLIEAFHEYRISRYTQTKYVPYDPNNKYVVDLMNAFRDIFVEPDVLEYILFHAATGLDDTVVDHILIILGGGANGKTFTLKMVHETLGEYAKLGKATLLTDKAEQAGNANSAQMQMMGVRYFYMEELNRDAEINPARLKSIVNDGKQSGRELYSAQVNFDNTATVVAASNYPIKIGESDHGTWRRIAVYHAKTTFVEGDPKPGDRYQRKKNPNLIKKCPKDENYRSAMLSIMVEYYTRLQNEYDGDINKVPKPTIDRETMVYRNKQDKINEFLTKMVVVSPGAEEITEYQLAEKYQEWYLRFVGQSKKNLDEIRTDLSISAIGGKLVLSETRNVKVLTGHRVLGTVGEELLPHETPFYKEKYDNVMLPKLKDEIEDQARPTRVFLPDGLPEDRLDEDIARLERNVPVHYGDIEEINLDELEM